MVEWAINSSDWLLVSLGTRISVSTMSSKVVKVFRLFDLIF